LTFPSPSSCPLPCLFSWSLTIVLFFSCPCRSPL
jgi:hypothetical protein